MGQNGSRIVANFTTEESKETCVKKCEGKRPQSVIDASKPATQAQAPAPATATPATLPPGSPQGGGARKRKKFKKKKTRKSRKSRKSSKKKRRTK